MPQPSEPGPPLLTVTEASFDTEVLQSTLPVVVEVSSEWCPPCKLAEASLRVLAGTTADTLKIVTIDAEQSPDLVSKLRVYGVPMFMVFYKGKELDRDAGYAGRAQLQRWVESVVTQATAIREPASASEPAA